MSILKKQEGQQVIFEHLLEGILVAIKKENLSLIKDFWRKNKGKKEISDESIQGYPFVFDEEQQSLKIDFQTTNTYRIKDLKKFD